MTLKEPWDAQMEALGGFIRNQRKQANLSHAATAFLKVVRSLSQERGTPYEFRVERGG